MYQENTAPALKVIVHHRDRFCSNPCRILVIIDIEKSQDPVNHSDPTA